MSVLETFLIQPLSDIVEFPLFFIEVVIGGLSAGVMYSLVALGFVLIFKASGVFNFAQGIMVVFGALSLVGLYAAGVPAWIALLLCIGIMFGLAISVEKLVLRPLVNQPDIILFMATIGLAYFLEGVADLMWGSEIKTLDVGLPQGINLWIDETTFNIFGYGFFIDNLDIVATIIAALLVAALVAFSQYTKQGRAMRAVADDHQAALSVGISLNFIWIMVWSVAGFVALVAGIMWGTKSGVQFSLSLIALKALPVLMLGGFTSIPGAIVGGLIIGVGEKLFEFAIGPLVGGATENWFAYVLALIFLVFRPQGLFGEKIIERV